MESPCPSAGHLGLPVGLDTGGIRSTGSTAKAVACRRGKRRCSMGSRLMIPLLSESTTSISSVQKCLIRPKRCALRTESSVDGTRCSSDCVRASPGGEKVDPASNLGPFAKRSFDHRLFGLRRPSASSHREPCGVVRSLWTHTRCARVR